MEIKLVQGDITDMKVDAIVNAANTSLLGGGGVDGAIHRAGGPAILAACVLIRQRKGGCKTGEAVITTAGDMAARYVIHTAGPVWEGGKYKEKELLRNCYINSLKLADENGLKSIAFPNISTGVYKFPKDRAAEIAVDAVRSYFEENDSGIEEVFFVCFDEENYGMYEELMG